MVVVSYTIYNFCFYNYCLMPVFCIKLLFIFLYFAISSSFHLYYLNTYNITNNNRKNINTFNSFSQFPRLYVQVLRILLFTWLHLISLLSTNRYLAVVFYTNPTLSQHYPNFVSTLSQKFELFTQRTKLISYENSMVLYYSNNTMNKSYLTVIYYNWINYIWINTIIICISSVSSVAAPQGWKLGKFAKDWEKSTFQPEIRIDSRNNFKFTLNFSKFLLKFS